MIKAGLLNKTIVIQHLRIERDDYGSDIEKWRDIRATRASVKGSDSRSLMTSPEEVYSQPNLLFTIRRQPDIFRDVFNHYRIKYDNKYYTVMNINNEERDNTIILGRQYND
jgi:head-tail adaptor